MEYQYPIDHDWSTEEIIDVISFFQKVEQAYDKGVDRDQFLEIYRRFKEIVPGKAQERNICREFEEVSGFSSYRTVKTVKEAESGMKVKIK
ncbi:uncharacterized protein YktA (UPF0223 family) [Cytobacillus eiseniae]|uniref:UPF0223 protein J2Z40_000526 n=1 Tax=Cytobacillus eiseniae TaxID=762947 RepID=A0ABS4RAP9_9BACI|nr:UPF0223 family protein [Cytobacillus eiseniae]MBP2239973.1 uncharacterized protein YktA (UPF0223 family) [Cytobacillus eiseniae]